MIATFKFYDLDYNVIADYEGGSPMIKVSVTIEFQRVLENVLALIDTGSNVTLVQLGLIKNCTPIGITTVQTGGGPIRANQYAGTVTLPELNETVGAVITEQPIRHKIIIGRDILRHFRMIYDPLKPEFSLENVKADEV